MMSNPGRPASRWSTSMSIMTKSTVDSNQATPLVNVRRKLYRQSDNAKKSFAQHLDKSKRDIEELFKLYYSNDIRFDTFQRQIVTGTRIPATHTAPLSPRDPSINSMDAFDVKHSVSREEFSALPWNRTEQKPINNESITATTTTTTKQPSIKRSVQIRIDNNTIINCPVISSHQNVSPPKPVHSVPNIPEKSSSVYQEDLRSLTLVESPTFLRNMSDEPHENTNKEQKKSNSIQRPVSSKSSVLSMIPGAPPPSLLLMNDTRQKDSTILSTTSFSTMSSAQQKKQNRLAVVTGSAVIVRQRSIPKQSWSKKRTKSYTTLPKKSSIPQSTIKNRPSSTCNLLSIQPDISELSAFEGVQRVVSIPSKCSRYVLVTFPEAPLRYNAPSYVERLLLPERFPTLFQNIVQSHNHHLTSAQHH